MQIDKIMLVKGVDFAVDVKNNNRSFKARVKTHNEEKG